jgi:hypothetical protein
MKPAMHNVWSSFSFIVIAVANVIYRLIGRKTYYKFYRLMILLLSWFLSYDYWSFKSPNLSFVDISEQRN